MLSNIKTNKITNALHPDLYGLLKNFPLYFFTYALMKYAKVKAEKVVYPKSLIAISGLDLKNCIAVGNRDHTTNNPSINNRSCLRLKFFMTKLNIGIKNSINI